MRRPYVHHLAIVHAAHGAELLLKARIAQEHPLLIFKKLPKSTITQDMLNFEELFEMGRTYTYEELPEILWATTGYRLHEVEAYKEFGKLRNTIVHFAAPAVDAATETLKFVFEILDPLALNFWQESFVIECAEWDDVILDDGYLLEQLERNDIDIHPQTLEMLREEAGTR